MSAFAKDIEQSMVTHMNEDHVDAIYDYCRINDIDTNDAEPVMVGVDFDGFDVQVKDKVHRINFPESCDSPSKVRQALVAMAHKARQQ